ncbi:MAG: hypothetical protein NTZ97_02365 [Candidatus Moranbacteria bacterium]|nr:hypothetical protein [Candidatus Moranbacteria bacterium]
MYWLYFLIFVIAILVPDIVQHGFGFLPEENLEEVLIFFLGVIGFSIFLIKDRELFFQKKEKEKNQKKLQKTSKDLLETFHYIGEVNRKVDILMAIALGLADRSEITKSKEKEFYHNILKAAQSLLKARYISLRFFNLTNGKNEKVITLDGNNKHTYISNE